MSTARSMLRSALAAAAIVLAVAPASAHAASTLIVEGAESGNRVVATSYVQDYEPAVMRWRITNVGPDPAVAVHLDATTNAEASTSSWSLDGVDLPASCQPTGPTDLVEACDIGALAVGQSVVVRRDVRPLFQPSFGHETRLQVSADGGAPVERSGWLSRETSRDDPPTCTAPAQYWNRTTVPRGATHVDLAIPPCTDPEGFPVTFVVDATGFTDNDNRTPRPIAGTAVVDGSTIRFDAAAPLEPGGLTFTYHAVTGTYPPTGQPGTESVKQYHGVEVVTSVDVSVVLQLPAVLGGDFARAVVVVRNTGPEALGPLSWIQFQSVPHGANVYDRCCDVSGLAPGETRTFSPRMIGNPVSAEQPVRVDAWVSAPWSRGPGVGIEPPAASAQLTLVPHQPKRLTSPRIVGTPIAGRPITCTGGSFSPRPFRSSYSWSLKGDSEAGATGARVDITPGVAGRYIRCTLQVDTSWGRGYADTQWAYVFAPLRYVGTRRADLFVGDRRANVADMGAGNDTVALGPGNDVVRLGAGNDLALGEAGNDVISCGTGKDRVAGGPGSDTIDCRDGRGDDLVVCGPGRDTVRADRGDKVYECERRA